MEVSRPPIIIIPIGVHDSELLVYVIFRLEILAMILVLTVMQISVTYLLLLIRKTKKNINFIKQNFVGGGVTGTNTFKLTEWEMF
jgi:hypothetical protein